MKTSIADAEISVRSLVDRDLAALPQSFGDPSAYRPRLVAFYVDQLARQMAGEILDASIPSDVQGALADGTIQTLRERLSRAVNG